jgi:hypothetical protein
MAGRREVTNNFGYSNGEYKELKELLWKLGYMKFLTEAKRCWFCFKKVIMHNEYLYECKKCEAYFCAICQTFYLKISPVRCKHMQNKFK